MRWGVFSAIICIATSQDFQLGHNHPAAGPDSTGLIARNLHEKDVIEEKELSPEALIDPDGRHFIAPLKQKSLRIEKELREEAEEIARLLNDDNSDVSFSVCLLSMVGCFWSCFAVLSQLFYYRSIVANISKPTKVDAASICFFHLLWEAFWEMSFFTCCRRPGTTAMENLLTLTSWELAPSLDCYCAFSSRSFAAPPRKVNIRFAQ